MNTDDLARLLTYQERPDLEFKAPHPFDGAFRAHLTATIASMANHPGGGTIIIGITTTNGHHEPTNITTTDLATYDTSKVHQHLKRFLDPAPSITIQELTLNNATVLALQIQEFQDTPILITKTLQDENDRPYAREGDLLIRSASATTRRIQDADELRALLGRAITKKSEDLLEHIKAVVTGASPRPGTNSPPERFATLLPDWPEARDTFDTAHPHGARWEVQLLPLPVGPPLDPKIATMLTRDTKASYRDWPFPHFPMNQDPGYYEDHATSTTDEPPHHELLAYSYRGAIGFRRILWTDLIATPQFPGPLHQRPVSAIDILWSMTEFFRYTLNLLETLRRDEAWLRITLDRIGERRLGNHEPHRDLTFKQLLPSRPSITLQDTFTTPDLQSTWKEHAITWTKRIYTIFQWPDATDDMLRADQETLLQRRW